MASEIHSALILGDSTKLRGGGPGWDPLLASKRMARKPRRAQLGEVAA